MSVPPEKPPTKPGTDLVVAAKRQPIKLTRFGGNTDRAPTKGVRKVLYQGGFNLGATTQEIIATERRGAEKARLELRATPGTLCLGCFSHKGGVGKTTLSTAIEQLAFEINPVAERAIIIDINTSMTNLDALNGLDKRDFLTGKFWTMETLYDFLVAHPDIKNLAFYEINSKLAYRSEPQLPIIPLKLKAGRRGKERSKLTAEQLEVVLYALKKFFTLIIFDFGTDEDIDLPQEAFANLHMLAILTHTGYATTQMVGQTLEMLYLNYPELFLNTTVVFNMSSAPSPKAKRAIALEKAGKTSKLERVLKKLEAARETGAKAIPEEGDEDDGREIQTPGQALQVINEIIEIDKLIDPLGLEEIVQVGFDPHLKRERKVRLNEVSATVRAQLWTVFHRMLKTRAEFERQFLEMIGDGQTLYRDQMKVTFIDQGDGTKEVVRQIGSKRIPPAEVVGH